MILIKKMKPLQVMGNQSQPLNIQDFGNVPTTNQVSPMKKMSPMHNQTIEFGKIPWFSSSNNNDNHNKNSE